MQFYADPFGVYGLFEVSWTIDCRTAFNSSTLFVEASSLAVSILVSWPNESVDSVTPSWFGDSELHVQPQHVGATSSKRVASLWTMRVRSPTLWNYNVKAF